MLGVARRNPRFRRLWLAQVVSEAGDWLNRVAILTLIGNLGGGQAAAGGLGLLFGGELAIRLLPSAFMGPLAGPIADRLPRRFLMVAADVVRASIVVGFLFVQRPEQLPLLYGLLALQMSVGIFFQSARSASVPNTVPRAELHEAYTLTAATWSAMLSIGALLGGLLVHWIGTSGVFVVDAVSYLLSAVLLIGLRLPSPPEQAEPFHLRNVLLGVDLRRALAHARALGVLVPVGAKTLWGGAGGFLVLLSLAANERFDAGSGWPALFEGGSAATAVGLLYCARGVGTGLGPILARRFHGSSERALYLQVATGFAVGALGYVAFAFCDRLVPALLWVVFAHMGRQHAVGRLDRPLADARRGRVPRTGVRPGVPRHDLLLRRRRGAGRAGLRRDRLAERYDRRHLRNGGRRRDPVDPVGRGPAAPGRQRTRAGSELEEELRDDDVVRVSVAVQVVAGHRLVLEEGGAVDAVGHDHRSRPGSSSRP